MDFIQDLWSQFLAMSCPLWIPIAVGLAVLFLIVIPLAVKRGKWKYKFMREEDENRELRSKSERDLSAEKEKSRKEIEKMQKDSEKKLREAKRAAKEEADRISAEADNEIASIIRNSELDLMAAKERMDRTLHEEREVMAQTEEELRQMDEKELLILAMKTLGGYGTRLDRLESEIMGPGRKLRYQPGAVSSPQAVRSAAGNGSTPLLDYLRDELNAISET